MRVHLAEMEGCETPYWQVWTGEVPRLFLFGHLLTMSSAASDMPQCDGCSHLYARAARNFFVTAQHHDLAALPARIEVLPNEYRELHLAPTRAVPRAVFDNQASSFSRPRVAHQPTTGLRPSPLRQTLPRLRRLHRRAQPIPLQLRLRR